RQRKAPTESQLSAPGAGATASPRETGATGTPAPGASVSGIAPVAQDAQLVRSDAVRTHPAVGRVGAVAIAAAADGAAEACRCFPQLLRLRVPPPRVFRFQSVQPGSD